MSTALHALAVDVQLQAKISHVADFVRCHAEFGNAMPDTIGPFVPLLSGGRMALYTSQGRARGGDIAASGKGRKRHGDRLVVERLFSA